MFWLELLIVSVLANVFWAGLFCLIKIRLSHTQYQNLWGKHITHKEGIELNDEIEKYRYGESNAEQAFSVLSAVLLIFPFLFIERLPKATAAAYRSFWWEILR